jgi:hypothetical protein
MSAKIPPRLVVHNEPAVCGGAGSEITGAIGSTSARLADLPGMAQAVTTRSNEINSKFFIML